MFLSKLLCCTRQLKKSQVFAWRMCPGACVQFSPMCCTVDNMADSLPLYANRCGTRTMCVCWCLATRSLWRFCDAPSWQPTTLSCLKAATEPSTCVMMAKTPRSASGWTPWQQMSCMYLGASAYLVSILPSLPLLSS